MAFSVPSTPVAESCDLVTLKILSRRMHKFSRFDGILVIVVSFYL